MIFTDKIKIKPTIYYVSFIVLILSSILLGCSGSNKTPADTEVNVTSTDASGIRDNTPVVLVPQYNEDKSFGNEYINIDSSNSNEGYIYASYLMDRERVKLQISGNNGITYTYNLYPGRQAVIPLTAGSGAYSLTAYENISGDEYALVFATDLTVDITNELGPFLYPNEYVAFSEDSSVVAVAKQIVTGDSCDLDAVADVYDYVIKNITYDYEKAETVPTGYIPDVDEIFEIKTGICFDYAALMAAMLRSQRIPTRLEIGYANDAYHAWISVYTDDQGWINNIIQFDGTSWTLLDPTFAANNSDSSLKKLIGNGTEYNTMYTY